MCITQQPKAVRPAAVAPAPTRAQIEAQAAADRTSLVTQNAALVARRQGVFGNTTTTPLGDTTYGTSVAKFGAQAG